MAAANGWVISEVESDALNAIKFIVTNYFVFGRWPLSPLSGPFVLQETLLFLRINQSCILLL